MKKLLLFAFAICLALSNISCSVFQTISNIARLKFKLDTVNEFKVLNIGVSGKSKLSDFSVQDIYTITRSVASGTLPVTFKVNIQALNPSEGTGGYAQTDAALTKFPWRLYLNNKETISGDIASPITVPGKGNATYFPISVSMDLLSFFKENKYEDLMKLILSLGGVNKSTSRITIFAQPTISSSLGTFKYPSEIKIVDTEYSN